jgi:hypothetical protein
MATDNVNIILALDVIRAEELWGSVVDLSAGEFGGVVGVCKNEAERFGVKGELAFFVEHFGV